MNINALLKQPDFASLNEGQQITALAAFERKNMLISGGGGVGKSHLIRFLATYIPNLILTASTGIAAINIQGQTLDSFMGFGRFVQTPLQARKMDNATKERLSVLEALLIDEISMVRADRLDMVNQRLQAAKNNQRPFGGIQIIIVGDFCQLPPVVSNSKADKCYQRVYKDRLFSFEADCYEHAQFTPYVLNEYVRQGDESTRRILRNMRMGHKLNEVTDFLNTQSKGMVRSDSLRICKTNKRVQDINRYAFAQLKTQAVTAHGVRRGRFPNSAFPCDEKLVLKQHCRVLLTVNKPDAGYLNGDLGTLLGFQDHYLVVKLDRGHTVYVEPHKWEAHAYELNEEDQHSPNALDKKVAGTYTQYPVRLGYAITGHKSQGMTLDSAIVDLSGSFNADGLAYVVISRVKSLENLKLLAPLSVGDIRTSTKARDFTFTISMSALARRDQERKILLAA